jgi:hypothetical protein
VWWVAHDQDSLPAGHQETREGEQGLLLVNQPRMYRLVLLLLAGVMLCCLWVLLSFPDTAPAVPSALAGPDVGHVDRGAGTSAPLPDESYLLMSAEEVRETNRLPGNAYLLTMLLLACSFGASVLRTLLTRAGRQGATCSWIGDDRAWLAVACEEPSFLGVFRL